MKLDALREELKRDPPKPAKKPKAWRVRTVIRQRPLSLLRQPCPTCGGKRRLHARGPGSLVELTCRACGILWRAGTHLCRTCEENPVSDYDRVCGDCMAKILPPMHYRCRSTTVKKLLR